MIGMMPQGMVLLAAEVAAELSETKEAAEGSGFGIGSDILGSNLINILIIIGLLVYLSRNVIGQTLATRRAAIVKELELAEQKKQAAVEQLADQRQKLAKAQQEAERIRQQAEVNAQTLRVELLAQADREVERIRANAEKDVSTEQERVIEELRRQIALQALAQVEADLPQRLNDQVQQRLIDQNIQLLGR